MFLLCVHRELVQTTMKPVALNSNEWGIIARICVSVCVHG